MNDGHTIKEQAEKIIQRRVLYASGLGLIPLPVVDVASIFATQVLMVREIADLYNVPFDKNRTQSIIGVLVLDVATIGVVKSIPFVGSLFGGVTLSVSAAAATYAIGKVFVEHFSQGGTLLSFDPQQSREYFKQQYDKGLLKDTAARPAKKNTPWGAILMLWLFITIIFGGILFFVARVWNNAHPPLTITETYLEAQERQAVAVPSLQEMVMPELEEILNSFAPYSAEAEILAYVQSKNASYPKHFVLDNVQFVGSSNVLSSSGSQQQMENIAAILKKYPELLVDIYGQTDNVGAKLIRQRVGRERARILRNTIVNAGVAAYRITGNHIEVKRYSQQPQYWGAEIVLRVDEISKNY